MSKQNSQSSQSRKSFPQSEQKAHPGATVAGKVDPRQVISVSIIVNRKNPLDLGHLGGRHLSQEEFADRYGADPVSFDQMRAFASKYGLAVDEGASCLARRTIVLRGPANLLEQAFGVQLSSCKMGDTTFHSYVGTISMDAEHASSVEAVLGLDTFPIAKPHFRLAGQRKKKKKPKPTPTPAPPRHPQRTRLSIRPRLHSSMTFPLE